MYYVILITVSVNIQQQYVGCYRDGGTGNPVMTGASNKLIDDLMTIDMCQRFCQQTNNTYFGLEVQLFVLQQFCAKYIATIMSHSRAVERAT